MKVSIKELEAVTKGKRVFGDPEVVVSNVSINSKLIKRGGVFIAIKGATHDGHDFVQEAVKNGASAVILSKRVRVPDKKISVIMVNDTIKALGQIAHFHRKKFNLPVIAITGSAGKTTTKDMVAKTLGSRYQVLRNHASFNNQIGVPLTLLKLTKGHEIAVLELGTNQPGDMEYLSKLVEPEIVVFTNIGESHLERLKTPAGVFKEKMNILKGMPSEGVVIYNADDQFLNRIPKMVKGKVVMPYSIKCRSANRAEKVKIEKDINFIVKGEEYQLALPVFHNIYNAIVAIICGRIFKIRYNDTKKALKEIEPYNGRMMFEKVGGCWIIDDTYNANPLSFKSALNTISNININGRKILICADMLELGSKAKYLHQAVGKMAAKAGLSAIFSCGDFAKYIGQQAKKFNRSIEIEHFDSAEALIKKLDGFSQKNDVFLLKASRGMSLEKIVESLKNNLK